MSVPPPEGLDPGAWAAIGATRSGRAWIIPERDTDGETIGESLRLDGGGKRMRPGSRRGLTYAAPLDPYAGSSPTDPILIVEGASDAAAGHMLGMATIGRPSATGGADLLRALLAGRHVAIVGENDSGAGRAGAEKIAAELAGVAASVRVVYPPTDAKDLRAWLIAGATRDDILAAVAEAEPVEPDPPPADDAPPRSAPVLLRMSDIEPAAIRWLWPGRIPLGRMTLLVGRPGDGKSFLSSYLAANVSRGRPWVDGSPCPAGSVILCSAEDDPADTIAPRLVAHDADRDRIHLLAGVRYLDDEDDAERERVFTLADLPTLRQTLDATPDCRLIIIDPIGSYLGGRTDAHRDNEVRGVLAPAAKLAAEYDAALLVVAHARKSAAAFADDMALGSRAFTGLARSVLHLIADPDDESKRRRLLLPGKNNLAERPTGLAFDIGPGPIHGRPCVRWHEGEIEMSADEAVNREPAGQGRAAPERDEATDWLRQALAAGERPAKDLLEQARETEGIAEKTLRRAMKAIGVEAFRPDNPGPWWWRLSSAAHAQAPQGEGSGHLAICSGAIAKADYSPNSPLQEAHGHMASALAICPADGPREEVEL